MRYSCHLYSFVISVASAQLFPSFSAQQSPNRPCYVCCGSSEPCDMILTNPDVIIPLPAFTGMVSATCGDIQTYGEEMMMMPSFACELLDREDFRLECGCTVATIEANESDMVSEETGVLLIAAAPADTDESKERRSLEPSSDLPSTVPSDVPSTVPSDVPSDTPSMVPSDTPSMVPSDMPSDFPSAQPLLRVRN